MEVGKSVRGPMAARIVSLSACYSIAQSWRGREGAFPAMQLVCWCWTPRQVCSEGKTNTQPGRDGISGTEGLKHVERGLVISGPLAHEGLGR